eukprot:27769_1
MLSLVIIITLFGHANACSLAMPQDGIYYINNLQFLDDTSYPDSVLLTIQRTAKESFEYTNTGPWCKLMNVNDGSVSNVVPCADYTDLTRTAATPDTPITVSCQDNCDGTTATCTIMRDQINYPITDVRYDDSDSTCDASGTSTTPVIGFGGIAVAFTVTDTSTTYISFSSNTVGVAFDDTTSPVSYTTFDVQREGDWSYLLPGGMMGDSSPSVYSAVNVIQVSLPCCICYGHALKKYTITTATTSVGTVQVMDVSGLGFSGGKVDVVEERAFGLGISYSTQVSVYDLSTDSDASVYIPELCDVMEDSMTCNACSVANCVYDFSAINADCVNDYCGGCNARWLCGSEDITDRCDATLSGPPEMCTSTVQPTTTTAATTEATTTETVTTQASTAATTETVTTEASTAATTETVTTAAATTETVTTEASTAATTETVTTEAATTVASDTTAATDDLGCDGNVLPPPIGHDCDDEEEDGCVLVLQLSAQICNINGWHTYHTLQRLVKETIGSIVETLDSTTECPFNRIRASDFDVDPLRDESSAVAHAANKPMKKDDCPDLDALCGEDGSTPLFGVYFKLGLYCGSCDELGQLALAFATLVESGAIQTDFDTKLASFSKDEDTVCEQGFRDVLLLDDIIMKRYDADGTLLNDIVVEIPSNASPMHCCFVVVSALVAFMVDVAL